MRTFLLVVVLSGLSYSSLAGQPIEQGDIAPNWILADLQGKAVSLYEEAEQGKWAVMIFWATWCSNCKILLPEIVKIDRQKGSAPVAFYLMNVWEDKDPAEFVAEQDYQLPVIRQAEQVAQRYGIRITPGIVVVDPDKRIQYVRQPSDDVATITRNLHGLLDIKHTSAH